MASPSVLRHRLLVSPVRDYGRMSQKVRFAEFLASLPLAEIPGVKVPLSPLVLNAAICCIADWICDSSVPQYATLAESRLMVPVGDEPNAALLRMAANSCCASCILA
jgi:hypothetical protein